MKRTRFLAIILALAMILPMAVVQTSAGISIDGKYNYIEIGEEKFIENGDFEEKPNLNNANLGASYNDAVDGYWNLHWFGTGKAAFEWDESNGWLVVETDTTPSLSYAPMGILEAGTYLLTFDYYAEDAIGKLNYNIYKDTGYGQGQQSLFNGSWEKDIEGNSLSATGTWYTISQSFTLAEDTDMVFRFYSNAVTSYRVDNFSLTRPTDILIESADMDSVSATAVSAVTTDAPADGVWAAQSLEHLALDTTGDGVHVVRKSGDTTIGDCANIAYVLPNKLDKGSYKLTLDVSSNGNSYYSFQIADVTSGYENNTSKNECHIKNVSISPSTNGGIADGVTAITFDVVEDQTAVGFRFWPSGAPAQPYSVNSITLEKYNKRIVSHNNSFDDPSSFSFSSKGFMDASNGTWWLANHKAGVDKLEYNVDSNSNGRIFADSNGGGFNVGYTFGNLPKGTYTMTFDVTKIAGSSGKLKYEVWQAIPGGTGYGERLVSAVPGPSLTLNNAVKYSVTFTVTEAKPKICFRLIPYDANNETGMKYYLDNFTLTPVESDDFTNEPLFKTEDGKKHQQANSGGDYGYWGYNYQSEYTAYIEHMNGVLECTTNGTTSFNHTFGAPLPVGCYIMKLDVTKQAGDSSTFRLNVYKSDGSNFDFSNQTYGSKQYDFELTAASSKSSFRLYPLQRSNTIIHLDNYSLEAGYYREWETVFYNDFSTAPTFENNTTSIATGNFGQYPGKWFLRDPKPAVLSYNSTNKSIDVTNSASFISCCNNDRGIDHTAIYYGFGNTLSKGNYTVEYKLTSDIGDKYYVSVVNRATGSPLAVSDKIELGAGASVSQSLMFSVSEDTDVVLRVVANSTLRGFSAYTIENVELYKLSGRVTGINSNGSIAQFDADTGVYYMIAGVQGANGYVNYSNGEEIREGIYQLTGKFKTAASGANLSASIGYYALDEVYAIVDEWTPVTFNVVLNNDTTLKPYTGIRLTVDNNANFYFKDLELVFVDDLPKPATKSAIAMIVLKKLQGGMKPQIEKKLYNFMDNADFDEAPEIREKLLNYGWTAQKAGEWALSINSADKDGTGSISYGVAKKEEALLVTASNTNPCVSYRLKDKLETGVYTLSIDVHADGKGSKGFMVDVFDMQSGAAVRIGEGGAIASRNVKAGEWSTMSVNFSAPANADIIFRFWSGSPLNYAVDNIQITKPGVFADGTTEEVVNDTKGFIKNGDFAKEPTIATKALGYGWAKAKDGEWAYSVNTAEQADAKCTVSYGDLNGEKCLKVDTNTTPSVSYALNGKLKPGAYTLTMDIYVEGSGTKTFNVDVFDTTTGSAVRTTAGAAIVNAKVEAGKWSTVSVPFTVTADADIVFRTFPAEKLSFYIDNVTLK